MLNNGWIIPAIPAVSFLLILFFGKHCPKKGSEIGITALVASFVLSCVAVYQWIDRVESASGGENGLRALGRSVIGAEGGHGEPVVTPIIHHITWWQNGSTEFGVGIRMDGLAVMMLFVVTPDLAARARLQHRIPQGRRPLHALLRDAQPVHGRDAHARRRRQHAADAPRVGRRGPLLVRADRSLVGGRREQPRRAQGVPHHPHRRHRPDDRHHHPVLHRWQLRHRTQQRVRAQPRGRPRRAARRRGVSLHRRDRQERSVPAAHVAARRHGGSDAGVGAHPRGHHGRRRRVPRRPPLPGVLQRDVDRGRWRQPDGADRRHHDHHRGGARVRAGRHQEGPRVLHHLAARLHGDGVGVGGVGCRSVPPVHPRLLQGAALPRGGVGEPLGRRTIRST